MRGKCFIEYIAAEKAWCPIDAVDYMFINCFWVSGQFKAQGNSNLLLAECIQDSQAKGKKGLVILSAKKKMPFLSDPSYLLYKDFKQADEFDPYYRLMYLPFQSAEQSIPKFKASLKNSQPIEPAFVLYYSHQCPFTAKYVPLIEKIAQDKNIPLKTILLESYEQTQNSPAIFSSYTLFYNGKFITNEILSATKF